MDLNYMVALPVPEPHLSKLSAVQEELRPAGWRITLGPHITIVAPGAAEVDPAAAIRQFAEAKRGFSSLRLSYPAVGSFIRRGLATLFLKPIDNAELYELQRRILIMAAGWQDTSRSHRRPFIPHVTLVNRLPEAEAEPTIQQLNQLVPLSINFDRLCLFIKSPQDKNWLQID